jgi:hypothetical protein
MVERKSRCTLSAWSFVCSNKAPAPDRQRIGALAAKVETGEVHLCQRLADGSAMLRVRPPHPHAVKEGDDGCRPSAQRSKCFACAALHRLRAGNAAGMQVLHQRQEEWYVARRHALFVQRQNVVTGAGVDEKIGILHALGDALVGQEFAQVVAGQELAQVFGGDVGVDGHAAEYPACALGATEAAISPVDWGWC